jgi:hypothetical protein
LTLSNIFPNISGNYSVDITNVYAGVTSNPALLTVLPPGIMTPAILTGGQFQFRFTSASGVDYGIQRSTNLISWFPLVTLNGNGTTLTFIDTNTPASQRSFYRIILSPQ